MDNEKPSEARQVELADKMFAGLYNTMREAHQGGIPVNDIAFCVNAAALAAAGGVIDLKRTLEEHIEWRKSKGSPH